ncbi:MAG: class II aldolase/adducin family protein [Actinobacteria bacterium]|nr:MAG: class II aldolase/adducin family protein [Actinomycetota bacterium]
MTPGSCGEALRDAREDLVAYGRRLAPDGLAIGTAGNLSCRVGDVVAITPRGVAYDVLSSGHICLMTLDGEPIEAPLGPSSELPMHLSVYRGGDAAAVVHTHSAFATTLGTLIDELPPIHYLISLLGGPVRVTPYATPGSPELADHMARALEGRSAVLLGNHGTITTGDTLDQAYSRALLLEWLCSLYYRARLLGEPRLLDLEEIDRVGRQLEHYLQDPT